MSKNDALQRAVSYDKFQGTTNAETLAWIVSGWIREPVLDIGAGDGSLIRAIKRRGIREVEGVDLTPRADFVREASITRLPFPEHAFHTVFSTEVIEHLELEQIVDGLAEIARVLKPSGRLIVTVPFEEDLARSTLACPECGCRFHRYGHRQTFTSDRLRKLLVASGFNVDRSDVYALGAMAILPMGRYFNWILRRMRYEFIANTIVSIAHKRPSSS